MPAKAHGDASALNATGFSTSVISSSSFNSTIITATWQASEGNGKESKHGQRKA